MIINKPKFWDFKKPNYLSYFLLPFTLPIIINNFFLGFKKIKKIKNIKTICFGNIYVGGTAKTPLTIKLNEVLQELGFKTATIKKFHKNQIDEQKLISSKSILYCEKKRNSALVNALKDDVDIAIFDDGLQDSFLNYDLSFVCFNNLNWIGNGCLIPSGPLREKLASISKYDAVFLTGNKENTSDIRNSIKKTNKNIKIFEAHYKAINIHKFNLNENYLIFSGIGSPNSFKGTLLKNKFKVIKEIIFPDHYQYTKKDIEMIKLQAINMNAKIITTEKDFVKISQSGSHKINFLEIDLLIEKQDELISFIKSKI
ncbi:tetraacyldisaccharide 4'-kinase [Candidatus Pelagibacter sp.]|nr:tetraacyldisaccharide 4'-kinase [Candidatus Pelagibacter sp.]